MNRNVKIALYVGLAACALIFGVLAFNAFRKVEGPRSEATITGEADPASPRKSQGSGWAGYGAIAFFAVLGLALLAARDVSHLFAGRVEQFIFNDNLEGIKDPEYEVAERVWANGEHLEAIQLMRDYLKKHPLEQYVALRIAEIYEKDLANYLAAALEYEEVLKKNLPSERWGWAAIHLSNLYSGKLHKPQEAEALLRRIIAEYPQTAAAKKARERLGESEAPLILAEPIVKPEQTDVGKSHLPPGFRPK